MAKRFFVAFFMTALVIAAAIVSASMIFSGKYDALAAETEAAAEASGPPQLPEYTPAPQTNSPAAPQQTGGTAGAAAAPEESRLEPAVSGGAAEMLSGMSLEEKVCQLLFVTPEALTGAGTVTQSDDTTRAALADYPVGGVILFSENLQTAEQTAGLLSGLQQDSRALTGRGLFLGIDEEGGTVARAADNLGTTAFSDMADYGREGDVRKAYEIGSTLAADLTALGFNVDFAPVADVLTNEENTVVKTRSFGGDPELVSAMVAREVEGLLAGGMLCAPKHFPGHGGAAGDTHDGFVSTDRTMDELAACDLLPFHAAIEAGAPMIMVGHMTVNAIDGDNPASLSSAVVTGLLRQQLGYQGIVITDSMDMDAVAALYQPGEAVVKALGAGCDMVLCVSDIGAAVAAVTAAVSDGTLTEENIDGHVTRVLEAKLQYGLIP